MRTWTSGRFGVPPMRRSAKSTPNASTRVRKASTRLSVSMEKKARAELRPLQEGNVAGVSPMSTERSAEVGYHPSVPPARGAMREEPVTPFGAAPGGEGYLGDAQIARLLSQDRAEVKHYRPGYSKTYGHFRTYFITASTNAY